MVWRAGRSRLCGKKGAIEKLYTSPPPESVVLCLDQMGPESAKSFPGQQLVRTPPTLMQPTERATQEIDYGRRGKGYLFGAFQPVTGAAFTCPYVRRTTANWVEFLEQVEQWVPRTCNRIYAILDNLSVHRATDVLLFGLTHPRWEFVFQPKYAAYLNLIEPWWKILRSLALKGRRFETWQQIEQAIHAATCYWNKNCHPFIWGRRRRHQVRRSPGIALIPVGN